MKTRTLLLLSLGCGVAIMLAGAVFLVQLTSQDDLEEPVEIGVEAAVGDMRVRVDAADVRGDGELAVRIALGGTEDDAPADDFRLIASGRPAPLASTTCRPTGAGVEPCTLTFDVSVADGTSRVLFYERGDQRARWVLDEP